MITSGFKQKQLGEIRRETSYPLLRTYIASIRVTALLIACFIGLLALLGIGGAWFALVISEPVAAKRQIGAAVATSVITLFTSGVSIAFVLIIARLFAQLYELLTDVGDCLVDLATTLRRFDQSGALKPRDTEELMDSPPSFMDEDPPTPAPVPAAAPVVYAPMHDFSSEADVGLAPVSPGSSTPQPVVQPRAVQRSSDPAAATAPAGTADDLAAANLLQLAQRHNRNGNKAEAVRCLKAIIERYPASAAATTARAALGKQR
jgi:hypothetical protein